MPGYIYLIQVLQLERKILKVVHLIAERILAVRSTPAWHDSVSPCAHQLMSAGAVFYRIDGKQNLFPSSSWNVPQALWVAAFGILLNVQSACASSLLGMKKGKLCRIYLPNVVKEKPRLTSGNCICVHKPLYHKAENPSSICPDTFHSVQTHIPLCLCRINRDW